MLKIKTFTVDCGTTRYDELLKLLFVIPANAGSSIPSEIAAQSRYDKQLKQDCGSGPQ